MIKRINLSDRDARIAIFKELNTNLFVEASAGSGKTTSLVNRMVALVEAGVPVEKICTITFTVAAADEFFSRFQELLSRRIIDNPNDESIRDLGPTTEESRKRCQEALNNIDLCFNGTMDSFCNMVAHEMPNELHIPSNAVVISEEESSQIIKEEYLNILLDNTRPLHSLATTFNSVFPNPFEAFQNGIKMIFDYRDYQVEYDKDLLSESNNPIAKELKDIEGLRDALIRDGLRYSKFKHIKNVFKLKNVNFNNWRDNAFQILEGLKAFDEEASFSSEVEGTKLEVDYLYKPKKNYRFNEDVLLVVNHIREVIMEYLFQLFFHFISQARDEIVSDMKKEGKFSFFDFLYYIKEEFKKSASSDRELISHIFERHSRILIDESQDTNPIQTELFFYLTSTVKTDDWTKAEPKEGSLFIVGDPKQSIYGFRDADVVAYNKTKGIFADEDEVIYLSKNYRSNIIVKEYFNRIMNKVLSRGKDVLTHPDIPITQDNEQEKQRYIWENNKEITLNGVYQYQASTNRDIDASKVAELINRIVDNDNYKIVSKKVPNKEQVARRIQYKDILVITKNKKVEEYIKHFTLNNIPFLVEATIFFNRSQTLDVLTKLLFLMFEPQKPQRFIDVMTSPIFNLNIKDIVTMKKDGFDLDISQFNGALQLSELKHQQIIEELHNLYTRVQGMSVSSTLFYLLTNKDFLFLDKVDTEYLEYAYYLVELVRSKENDGSIACFGDAEIFINQVLNNESGIERGMRFKKEVNQVKISNLHKVKGLQAPIVILAAPNSIILDMDKYVDRMSKKLYFSSIYMEKGAGKSKICGSNKYLPHIEQANASNESEKARLEYVAATRAESVLIIGNPVEAHRSNFENPWEDLLESDMPLVPEYDSSEHKVDQVSASDVFRDYQSDISEESSKASYDIKNPSGVRLRTAFTNEEELEEIDEDIDKALLGTLVHRLLECLVTSRNKYDLEALIAQITAEFAFDTAIYESRLRKVSKVFTSGGYPQSSSSVPQDLFKVLLDAEEVMCEVPFSYKNESNIISGVIDCIYKDSNGYHIIDYKTNAEGNIDNLEEEYKIQLGVYRKAFKNAFNEECDVHIYHLDA